MAKKEKVVLAPEGFVEINPTPSLNLPDLKTVACFRHDSGVPYFVFYCEHSQKYAHGCPCCGSIDYIYSGTTNTPRRVRDINIGINRVDLIVTVPRYHCKDCGAVFRHVFDSIPEGRACTYRLYEQIKRDSFVRPFSDVAEEFGYSEGSIRNIFDEFAAELESTRGPIVAPEVLGIDEKHIVHNMRGVFVDCKTGRLLEMTKTNKRDEVTNTIEKMVDYDKNIRIVTMDMSNGYRSIVQYCLPNAKIIVDKYHLYQDLNRKITTAKKGVLAFVKSRIDATTDAKLKKKLDDAYFFVSRNSYLFKFGRRNIQSDPRRASIMVSVCKAFPEFNHLRLIKEGFERIYEEATDKASAIKLYEEWVALIPPKRASLRNKWIDKYKVNPDLYTDILPFYNSTQSWYTEIFNYFEENCQYTNASAEGVNSLIQRINAQGAGYGFDRLRAKALYYSSNCAKINYTIDVSRMPVYDSKKQKPRPVSGKERNIIYTPTGYDEIHSVNEHRAKSSDYLSVFSYLPDEQPFYVFGEDDEEGNE